MLSPDVNDALSKLTNAYAGIVGIDSFALTCESISIVPLADEPDWLPAVATEFQQLDSAADAWQQDRASIWAPVILAFQDYFALFSGVASTLNPSTSNNPGFWIDALSTTLLPQVQKSLAATRTAQAVLEQRMTAFSSILPELKHSISAGWVALADEEQQMLELTEKLGALVDSVQSLGTKLTSDGIATDKGIAQSAVTMLYAAASAGATASVPVLGLAVAVLSIGKSFYDLIEDDNQLISTLNQINAIQAKLSDAALGVALTQSTLQTLYSVEEQYLGLHDALPDLIDLWQDQESRIQAAINALNGGAHPNQYLDLKTLPLALVTWQSINTFVTRITQTDFQVGTPVTIDIPKAEIRPTFPTLAGA